MEDLPRESVEASENLEEVLCEKCKGNKYVNKTNENGRPILTAGGGRLITKCPSCEGVGKVLKKKKKKHKRRSLL